MVQTPSMQEVFGPGGLLERCMTAGYEHRPAQLEMAELVHDAFNRTGTRLWKRERERGKRWRIVAGDCSGGA